MKSLFITFIITFFTLTLNAQAISFNALKESALGNDDVLKRELIENGWTMEETDNEGSYGYAYKNIIGLTDAFVIFFDSYISCRSTERLEKSIYADLYSEIKSKCEYTGVKTFTKPPIDYISYTHKDGVKFRIYSEDSVFYIEAKGTSAN